MDEYKLQAKCYELALELCSRCAALKDVNPVDFSHMIRYVLHEINVELKETP